MILKIIYNNIYLENKFLFTNKTCLYKYCIVYSKLLLTKEHSTPYKMNFYRQKLAYK